MGFGTLFDQIRTAFTGDGDLSGALNDLNFVDVVGSPEFPYGTYHYIAGSGRHTAGGARLAGRLIQFNLFDKGSDMSDLCDAYDKLVAVYDELNVQSGGRAYQFMWEADWVLKVDDVWQISCRYRVVDHPS
jgi:hypothetical protein